MGDRFRCDADYTPRRFGKTLNMSMLECFFSKKYEGRADLFEGLSIFGDDSDKIG